MKATKTTKRIGAAAMFAVALAVATLTGIVLTNGATFASGETSRNQLEADQAALTAVYTSLGKTVPQRLIHKWPGVTVQGGRITHLQIKHESGSGTISDRLGELTAVQELRLAGSGITGTLPASIGQLSELWYLVINDTGINGPLPAAELAALPKLDTVFINGNPSLGGSVPAALGKSASVRDLTLRGNGHTGSIPDGLFHDPDGHFGQSPMAQKLEHLNLEHNQITGPIPERLKLATKLKTLWLGHNQLTGGLPMDDNLWKRMSRLDVMQVHDNLMSGPLNPDLPKLMPNLNLISIDGNDWTRCLPETWWKHYNHQVTPQNADKTQHVGIRDQNLNIPRCAVALESITTSGEHANLVSAISPAFDMRNADYEIIVSNQADRFTVSAEPYHANGQVELNSHEDADQEKAGFQVETDVADSLPATVELTVTNTSVTDAEDNIYSVAAHRLEVDVTRADEPSATGAVEESSGFQLQATATNAGQSVTYRWTQTAGPEAEIRNFDSATLSATAPNIGSVLTAQLAFQVRVTDVATGVYSLQNAAVAVANVQTPPTGSITMTAGEGEDAETVADGGTVKSGTKVVIHVSASDADGDTVSHSARWRQRAVGGEYGQWQPSDTRTKENWQDKYYFQEHFLNDREIEVEVSITDGTHDPVVLTAEFTVTGAGSEYTIRFVGNKANVPGDFEAPYWRDSGTRPYPDNTNQKGKCLNIDEGRLNGVVQYVDRALNRNPDPNAPTLPFGFHWEGQAGGWEQVSGPEVALRHVVEKADVPYTRDAFGSEYLATYDVPEVTETTTLGFRMWADLPLSSTDEQHFERYETETLTISIHPCSAE